MTWPNTKMQDAYNASRADVPEGARRLQDMVEQSKAKLGEEWSAQGARGSTPMALEDYRKAQGRLSDLSGPAVTLEGLASVIGSLSEALQSLYGSNRETEETVKALCKAADAVTAILTKEVAEKEEPKTGAQAVTALDVVKTEAYNRAITDAHNAVAHELGLGREDGDGSRAQAAIRTLYRRTS